MLPSHPPDPHRGRPAPVPLVRAVQLRAFHDAALQLGIPVRRHLARARLPESVLEAPGQMIARRQLWAFCDGIAEHEGVPDFGLRVATADPVAQLGELGRRLLAAPTLAVALSGLEREIGAHSTHASFRVAPWAGGVRVARHDGGFRSEGSPVVEQYSLLLMAGIVRAAAPGWRPKCIWLRSGGSWSALHELLAEAEPIRGSGLTGIHVPQALLALPMPGSPGGAPASDGAVSEAGEFGSSLELALAPLVGHVRLDLEVVAEIVGSSARTVRSRLRGEGTSWRSLLDGLRFAHARARLAAQPDARLGEIALELGYADAAHFSRAFRRWARVTPSEYRRALSVGAAGALPPGGCIHARTRYPTEPTGHVRPRRHDA